MKSITKLRKYTVDQLINQHKDTIKIIENSSPLKSQIIETQIGSLLAISDDEQLLLLDFADSKNCSADVKRILRNVQKDVIENDSAPIISIKRELELYFNGELMEFKTPIILTFDSEIGKFSNSVWKEIHAIPYGERLTYAEIAKNIRKPSSYRAVANACGKNPFSIVVPCHRVVGSNGTLGGYSSGLERKIWLQNHEKQVLSK